MAATSRADGRGTLRIGNLKPAKGATHRRKRRGLGPASGLGGTAGRGHKGQRARKSGNVARWFEGGQMPIQRRLPKIGFTNIHRVPHQVVNVESLDRFAAGETVNRETLKAKRLIDRSDLPVKILGTGDLSLKLTVAVDAVSGSAREKIEAAGGSVTLPEKKAPRPRGVKKPARAEAKGGREAARASGRAARGSKGNKGNKSQGKVRA
jgi:large subunit ribosomal protein L15